VTCSPVHYAVLVNGRSVSDPLTEYRQFDSAEKRAASLKAAGHDVVLAPVPRALVLRRLAGAMAAT